MSFVAQYKLYGFHGCKGKDESNILNALKEAHTILGANGNYYLNDHWDGMGAIEYFGNSPDLKINNQRDGLAQNFRNAYSFTNGWWFNWHVTEVYCHDGEMPDKNGISYSTACGSSSYPDPVVVAKDYNGAGYPALML
jgi:hypothetical protein